MVAKRCASQLALLLIAAGLAGGHGDARAIEDDWEVVMLDANRRVEIDRATIIQSDAGTKVAWGRMLLSRSEEARVGYAAVKSLNRYDCENRRFVTIKRVYLDADNLVLREESLSNEAPVVVARNTVDERMWREVCAPPGDENPVDLALKAGEALSDAPPLPEPSVAPPSAAPTTPPAPPAPAVATAQAEVPPSISAEVPAPVTPPPTPEVPMTPPAPPLSETPPSEPVAASSEPAVASSEPPAADPVPSPAEAPPPPAVAEPAPAPAKNPDLPEGMGSPTVYIPPDVLARLPGGAASAGVTATEPPPGLIDLPFKKAPVPQADASAPAIVPPEAGAATEAAQAGTPPAATETPPSPAVVTPPRSDVSQQALIKPREPAPVDPSPARPETGSERPAEATTPSVARPAEAPELPPPPRRTPVAEAEPAPLSAADRAERARVMRALEAAARTDVSGRDAVLAGLMPPGADGAAAVPVVSEPPRTRLPVAPDALAAAPSLGSLDNPDWPVTPQRAALQGGGSLVVSSLSGTTGLAPGMVRPEASWRYEGASGPYEWHQLKPEWALCGSGRLQAPIDIREAEPAALPELGFVYRSSQLRVAELGNVLVVRVGSGMSLRTDGGRYALETFQFHRPGEVRFRGRAPEVAIHLHHRDAGGKRLVVVVGLAPGGTDNAVLAQVLANLPDGAGQNRLSEGRVDLTGLLPQMRGYYHFSGSLSAPPCTEGVEWLVLKSPLEVSAAQLAALASRLPYSARPVQPLNGRKVSQTR